MKLVRILAVLALVLLIVPGAIAARFAWKMGSMQAPPPLQILSVSISCGSSCSYISGTAGTIGTVSATLNTGSFGGSWSIQTTFPSTDNSGTTCVNYGTSFTVDSASGAVKNANSAPVGTNPGVCVIATQSGVAGSPFVQAFTIVGNSPPSVSTFNTVRNTGSLFSFSADKLTATEINSAPSGNNDSAFTTDFHSDVKRFFRFTIGTMGSCTGGGAQQIGAALLGESNVGYLGRGTSSFGIGPDGRVLLNNAFVGNTGLTFAAGNAIDIILDPVAKTVQEAKNGGTPSAVISIAGLSTQNVSPAIAPCAANDSVTFNGNPSGVNYPGAVVWDAPGPPAQFTSVAMSGLSFTTGSTNPVGTASATVSSGSNTATFQIQTSGTDNASTPCNNYGSNFSINNFTGVVTPSASAPAQSYPGFCVQATQAGLTNSPYSQAFTLVGTSVTGIACDIGPNYTLGPIPNPALAMGFTTCLNLDFTYTGTFTNKVNYTTANGRNVGPNGQYKWIDMNTWLDVAGAANSLFVRTNGGFNGINNQWQIVQDQGQQALTSIFIPGDGSPQISSFWFPSTNAFIEEVGRVDPLAYQNVTSVRNQEIIDDFGFFAPPPGKPDGYASVETDSGFNCQAVAPLGGSSPAQWATAGPNQACGGNGAFTWKADGSDAPGQPSFPPCCGILLSDGNYHTTAMLTAASRTTNVISYCGYYDQKPADGKGFGPCWGPTSRNGTFGDACYYEQSAACWQMGLNSIGTYVTGATQQTAQHWVRRITIWTCAGWNTPPTTGPLVGIALNTCDPGTKVVNANGGSPNAPPY